MVKFLAKVHELWRSIFLIFENYSNELHQFVCKYLLMHYDYLKFEEKNTFAHDNGNCT